ncbi:MAG TPA: S8 family serine peptidase [Pirellulales bacterium]|jgi:hypothetical protein|nr:S8 family serine peptidase [Pirellulales bacterium]
MKRCRSLIVVLCFLIPHSLADASQDTIGPHGINSQGLLDFNGQPLTGDGISIGEVEVQRPGKPNYDSDSNSNFNVKVAAVFAIENVAPPDTDVFFHAEWVASVMVSQDPVTTGVATQASLFASAYENTNNNSTSDADILLSIQKVASQTGMRAVNHSWGQFARPGAIIDGNSQISLGYDWIASNYDVLQVSGGDEGKGIPIPDDSFNGIDVGASTILLNGNGLVYRKVANLNTYDQEPIGGRTVIDLIAPGDGIQLTDFNGSMTIPVRSGTSYAAPMVTATAALLDQYGQQRLNKVAPNWSSDYSHHQVMKAVLMNSADKIQDNVGYTHAGLLPIPANGLLGMDRTVVMQDGTSTWFDSPAYDDDVNTGLGLVALDQQMGTGELDAKRALKQFAAGEYHSFQVSNTYTEVPVIGWDYGRSDARGSNFPSIYRLNQQLPAGSFISITLTFDRTVTKAGADGVYNRGDIFEPSSNPFGNPGYDQYTDLDLYLLPKNSANINQAIAESISDTGTVDHIFFQIPTTGEYEFWVDPFNTTTGAENYAVAWWADGVGALTSGAGDINQDGHVDSADIVAMEKALTNETGYASSIGIATDYLSLLGDVNGDGKFNNLDIQALINFLLAGNGSTNAVPEPTSLMLLAIGALALLRKRLGGSSCLGLKWKLIG